MQTNLITQVFPGLPLGGHLLDATVRPTLELIVEDAPAELRKTVDADSGMALINPEV